MLDELVNLYQNVIEPYGSLTNFFVGTIPGSVGETSAILCLFAFIYLTIFKVKEKPDAPFNDPYKYEKFANTPLHCFIENGDINGVKCPDKLDKQYYIDLAHKRLIDFGVIN